MDMIRAWKDPDYRGTLTVDELGALPTNPAGAASLRALTETELDEVAAAATAQWGTGGCGCGPTFQLSIFTNGTACLLTCLA